MKKIIIISLFLLASLTLDNLAASSQQQPKKQRSWYQSFHIANYLPDFIASRMKVWRAKRMFEGTRSWIDKLNKEYQSWKEEDMNNFVDSYNIWIDPFYDIINEAFYFGNDFINGKIVFYTKEEVERLKLDGKKIKIWIGDIGTVWFSVWHHFGSKSKIIANKIDQILNRITEMKKENSAYDEAYDFYNILKRPVLF